MAELRVYFVSAVTKNKGVSTIPCCPSSYKIHAANRGSTTRAGPPGADTEGLLLPVSFVSTRWETYYKTTQLLRFLKITWYRQSEWEFTYLFQI